MEVKDKKRDEEEKPKAGWMHSTEDKERRSF